MPSGSVDEIETRQFIQDLGISYKIECDNDSKDYILSYPDKSSPDIRISYTDLKETIDTYKTLNFDGKSLFIRQFIFLGMIKVYNDFSIDNLEQAEQRLDLINKRDELNKEFDKVRSYFKESKKKDFYYGFKEFRGGK